VHFLRLILAFLKYIKHNISNIKCIFFSGACEILARSWGSPIID
jgi:hypothetical protein